MKKIISIFLFISLYSRLSIKPIRAISVTPKITTTPSVTLSPTPQVTVSPGSIEEKIQEIRDEVKKKVREKIEETKKGMKVAYIGEITDITDSSLTITTFTGVKNIKVATDTTIVNKGNKKIALKDLEIGNFIIAMGYISDTNLLDARRIIVINKPKIVVREVAFGKVTDISTDEKILTIKNEKKNLLYTVEVTDKTIITKKIDGKIKKVKFADVAIGDRIVAIGTPTENENKIITAKLIHVIPGLALSEQSESKGQEKPTITVTSNPTKSPAPTE